MWHIVGAREAAGRGVTDDRMPEFLYHQELHTFQKICRAGTLPHYQPKNTSEREIVARARIELLLDVLTLKLAHPCDRLWYSSELLSVWEAESLCMMEHNMKLMPPSQRRSRRLQMLIVLFIECHVCSR